MRVNADYVLIRLILLSGAALGGVLVSAVVFFVIGTGVGGPDASWLHCSLEPASPLDAVMHVTAVALGLLALVPLLSGLRAARQARKSSRQLQRATRQADQGVPYSVQGPAEIVGLVNRIDVVQLDHPLAFTYGLVQPRVCVSTALLESLIDDELQAVLWHEAWHVARKDPMRLSIVQALKSTLVFIPELQRLANLSVITMEIAADRHVLTQMGHPRALARALLKVGNAPAGAIGFQGHLNARVAALGQAYPEMPRGRGRVALAALLLEGAIVMVLLSNSGLPSLFRLLGHPIC